MSPHEDYRTAARGTSRRQYALDCAREAATQPATADGWQTGPTPVPARRRAAIAMVTTLVVSLALAVAAYVLILADVRADVKAGIRDGWRETAVTNPN